jgi:hypothetical protein
MKSPSRNCGSACFVEVFGMERAKGIEPSYAAWEAAVLPLNYARNQVAAFLGMIFSENRWSLFSDHAY